VNRCPRGHGRGRGIWEDTPATAHNPIMLIRAPTLTDQVPYAYAAVASDVHRLVFTAGACPLDKHGETVAVGDVAGQAEQAMANLRGRAGGGWLRPH
jgi:enamine deaminase RidA (YjgF/YER057c/UK114 family)